MFRTSLVALLVLTAATLSDAHDGPFVAHADSALTTKPTKLHEGIGHAKQKVSTSSEKAQAFYDQGLAHLHSYRWIEAARSFHEALRLSPNLAMAHLGLARAYEGLKDETAADQEATAAETAAKEGASGRERAYIAAYRLKRLALDTKTTDRGAASEKYQAALDALIQSDETDAEAWLLRGNASEGPWGRGQGGDESSIPFYEGALRAVPGHFAAHHYLAHTYENLGRADEAAANAKIFATASPNVPHARHMYAHTLPRIGRWDEAVSELEAARRLEDEFATAEGLPPSHDWHRVHNLTLLGLAYLHTGQDDKAEATLREAFDTDIPDPLVQSWHSVWPEFLLLQSRPDEAIEAANVLSKKSSPMLQVIGAALEGEALLDKGSPHAAQAASKKARRLIEKLQETTATHPHSEALVWVAREYANVLDARRALHNRTTPEWLAFVGQVTDQIASDPTFDGWGTGWLRLRRIERDARYTGHHALTERLQGHLERTTESPDAK